MSTRSVFVPLKQNLPVFEYPIEFIKESSANLQKTYDTNFEKILKNTETIMGMEALHPTDKSKLKEIQNKTQQLATTYANYDLSLPSVQYIINKEFNDILKDNDMQGILKHNEQIKKAKAAYDALEKEGKAANYTNRDFKNSYENYKAFDPNYEIATNMYDYRDYRKKLADAAKGIQNFYSQYSSLSKYETTIYNGKQAVILDSGARGGSYVLIQDSNNEPKVIDISNGNEVTEPELLAVLSPKPSDYTYVDQRQVVSLQTVIQRLQGALDAEDIRRAGWDLEYLKENNNDYYVTEIETPAKALNIDPLAYFLYYNAAESYTFERQSINNLQLSLDAKIMLENLKNSKKGSSGSGTTKKEKAQQDKENDDQKNDYYNRVTGQTADTQNDTIPISSQFQRTDTDVDLLELVTLSDNGTLLTSSEEIITNLNTKIEQYKDASFLQSAIETIFADNFTFYGKSDVEKANILTKLFNSIATSNDVFDPTTKRYKYIDLNSPTYNKIKTILSYAPDINTVNAKDIIDAISAIVNSDSLTEDDKAFLRNISIDLLTDSSPAEAIGKINNSNSKSVKELFNNSLKKESNIEAVNAIVIGLNQMGYNHNVLLDVRDNMNRLKDDNFKGSLSKADRDFYERYIKNYSKYSPQFNTTTNQGDVLATGAYNTKDSRDRLFDTYEAIDYIASNDNFFGGTSYVTSEDFLTTFKKNIKNAMGLYLREDFFTPGFAQREIDEMASLIIEQKPVFSSRLGTNVSTNLDAEKAKELYGRSLSMSISAKDNDYLIWRCGDTKNPNCNKENVYSTIFNTALRHTAADMLRTAKAKMSNTLDNYQLSEDNLQKFYADNLIRTNQVFSSLFTIYNPNDKDAIFAPDEKYIFYNAVSINSPENKEKINKLSYLARYELQVLSDISPVINGTQVFKKYTTTTSNKISTSDITITTYEMSEKLKNNYSVKVINPTKVEVNRGVNPNPAVIQPGESLAELSERLTKEKSLRVIGIKYTGMFHDGNDWKMTGKLIVQDIDPKGNGSISFLTGKSVNQNGVPGSDTDIVVSLVENSYEGKTNTIINTFLNTMDESQLTALIENRLASGNYNRTNNTYTFKDNNNLIDNHTVTIVKNVTDKTFTLSIRDNNSNKDIPIFGTDTEKTSKSLYELMSTLNNQIKARQGSINIDITNLSDNERESITTFLSNDFMYDFESGANSDGTKLTKGTTQYTAQNNNALGKYQIMVFSYSNLTDLMREAAAELKTVEGKDKYLFPQMITARDFLADHELQDATMEKMIAKIYMPAIMKLKKKYPIANAYCLTQLLYIVHREGVAGAESFLRDGIWVKTGNTNLPEDIDRIGKNYCN